MKLASYLANGKDAFGVVTGDGVVTMNERLGGGINYRSHAAETGRELPKQPSMFIRLANTLTGHEGEMIRPSVSQHFDFEGELALVIGRGGRHIPVERALEHVAGYTCLVDGSVRDYQKFSVTSGKNFPGTGPLGPWIVTTDRSEEHTSELQSLAYLVCRLLLEKK